MLFPKKIWSIIFFGPKYFLVRKKRIDFHDSNNNFPFAIKRIILNILIYFLWGKVNNGNDNVEIVD